MESRRQVSEKTLIWDFYCVALGDIFVCIRSKWEPKRRALFFSCIWSQRFSHKPLELLVQYTFDHVWIAIDLYGKFCWIRKQTLLVLRIKLTKTKSPLSTDLRLSYSMHKSSEANDTHFLRYTRTQRFSDQLLSEEMRLSNLQNRNDFWMSTNHSLQCNNI